MSKAHPRDHPRRNERIPLSRRMHITPRVYHPLPFRDRRRVARQRLSRPVVSTLSSLFLPLLFFKSSSTVFSNILKETHLQVLAESDEHEVVRQVQARF